MKCVYIRLEGKPLKVVRCDDEVAHQLVKDNRAEYAPKKDWKLYGREYK